MYYSGIYIKRIIKSNRKTCKIEIDNNAEIIIRVPIGIKKIEILELVEKNKNWINKNIIKIQNRSKFVRKYSEGEYFFLLGEKYPLEVEKHTTNSNFKFEDNKFIISETIIPYAAKYFENFYKLQAKKILAERVFLLAQKMGLTINKLRITSAKTRWGSCSASGNINFSWRLVMAPPKVIDYVIVHELCHLIELNHSEKFWNLVKTIMPDYKEHVDYLNKNSIYFIL